MTFKVAKKLKLWSILVVSILIFGVGAIILLFDSPNSEYVYVPRGYDESLAVSNSVADTLGHKVSSAYSVVSIKSILETAKTQFLVTDNVDEDAEIVEFKRKSLDGNAVLNDTCKIVRGVKGKFQLQLELKSVEATETSRIEYLLTESSLYWPESDIINGDSITEKGSLTDLKVEYNSIKVRYTQEYAKGEYLEDSGITIPSHYILTFVMES